MKKQKPKEQEKQLPAAPQNRPRSLQSFSDYVDLVQDTINGVLDKTIQRQDAHTIAILTGYGVQALREASGGKLKMSIFLQDMQKSRIKVEKLSADEMDRFLQGSEDIQMEVLQSVVDRDGLVKAEAVAIPKQKPRAKFDTKLLSDMTGMEQGQIRDVLQYESEVRPELAPVLKHEWNTSLCGTQIFCVNCGIECGILETLPTESRCSGEWGL